MQSHLQAYGDNCLACHDGIDTYGHNFDHQKVAFPLTGKHVQVACDQCHQNDRSLTDLRNTPTDCVSCHKKDNPHSDRLSTDCASCHTTADWASATIDHNLTAFKLEGEHVDVPCGKCHLNNVFNGTPTDCYSCHKKDDKHNGQYGTDCSLCHKVTGWQTTLDHNLFAFKLTGKHTSVACTSCHVNSVFKGTPTNCVDCHAGVNPHSARLGDNCASCHTTSAWIPATFDHNLAAFHLEGQHVGVPCASCHINNVFRGTPTDCYSCHKKDDKHNGQYGTDCSVCHKVAGWLPAFFDHNLFAFKLTGKHIGVACSSCHANNVFKGTPSNCVDCHGSVDPHSSRLGTDCAACHTTNGWTPATFDHNLAAFKLTGQHVQVACTACHVNNVYQGTPSNCYACHKNDDAHSGQFGTDCAACHSTNGWLPANFDHSGFPLTNGHAGLACSSCHSSGVYAGLSTACASCHAEPAFHSGLFTSDCAQCHTTSNWNGTYTGPHPGGCDGNCINHERATCRDCHTVNLSTATCLKCHNSNNPGD